MTHRRNQGYGLIEILASVAIMAGALLVSFDLIDQSLRVFGESDAAGRNPLTIAAEMAIRRDVQSAAVLPTVGTASTGVLKLRIQDGSTVIWRRERGALIRREEPDGQPPIETRPLGRGVVGWWWEVKAPALLEVRFELAAEPHISGLRQTGLPDKSTQRVTHTVHLSPRGLRGDGSW